MILHNKKKQDYPKSYSPKNSEKFPISLIKHELIKCVYRDNNNIKIIYLHLYILKYYILIIYTFSYLFRLFIYINVFLFKSNMSHY